MCCKRPPGPKTSMVYIPKEAKGLNMLQTKAEVLMNRGNATDQKAAAKVGG